MFNTNAYRFALGAVILLATGCGLIADKDRIKVATFLEEHITRGDLAAWIRDQPDDERPTIRVKDDVRDALTQMIEERVKEAILIQLEASNLVYTDMADKPADIPVAVYVPRSLGEQAYYSKNPEHQIRVADPSALDLSQAQYDTMLMAIDMGIDREHRKFMAEAALAFQMRSAAEEGMVKVTKEDLYARYEQDKEKLIKLEQMTFDALVFPTTDPDHINDSAEARRLIDAGESFDTFVAIHMEDQSFIRTGVVNDPNSSRFEGFWQQAKGAKVGDILGPIFLPAADFVVVDAEGNQEFRSFPDVYVVLEVMTYTEPEQRTFEDAVQNLELLALPVLRDKTMAYFYEEFGITIFEDELPDPDIFNQNVG
jgi:hypothetical protein